MGDQSVTDQFVGNFLGLISVINEVHSTLETGFLDMAESTSTSKDLRLNDTAAFDAAGNSLRLIRAEGNIADRDGHLVRVKQGTCLILVKL